MEEKKLRGSGRCIDHLLYAESIKVVHDPNLFMMIYGVWGMGVG
jgi:hypothetical protein